MGGKYILSSELNQKRDKSYQLKILNRKLDVNETFVVKKLVVKELNKK